MSGTGSAGVTLNYHFDTLADVPVVLGVNGAFDQPFDVAALHSGNHTLTLTGTDAAGNVKISTFSVTIPFPAPPTELRVDPASDSGVSQSDGITQVNRPVISGRADAFSTVQVFNGMQLLGQATANDSGNWLLATTQLADGRYRLTARAFNPAGDSSGESAPLSILVDTKAPTALIQPFRDSTPDGNCFPRWASLGCRCRIGFHFGTQFCSIPG